MSLSCMPTLHYAATKVDDSPGACGMPVLPPAVSIARSSWPVHRTEQANLASWNGTYCIAVTMVAMVLCACNLFEHLARVRWAASCCIPSTTPRAAHTTYVAPHTVSHKCSYSLDDVAIDIGLYSCTLEL